jgi:hypothetical protein
MFNGFLFSKSVGPCKDPRATGLRGKRADEHRQFAPEARTDLLYMLAYEATGDYLHR